MSWRNRQDIWSVHPHLSHVMKCGQSWFRQHRKRRRRQQRRRWPQARQFTAPAKTLPGQRNNARTRVQCTAAAAAAAELTNLTVMKSLRRCKWKQGTRRSVESTPHAYPGLPCHFGTTGCWQPACCPRWCTSE